jgi:putative tricarboxylic transport membrane protein
MSASVKSRKISRPSADTWAALAFAALGAYIVAQAWRWEYTGPEGPGAGFFPLWYGVAMIGLSVILLITSLRRTARDQHAYRDAERIGAVRVEAAGVEIAGAECASIEPPSLETAGADAASGDANGIARVIFTWLGLVVAIGLVNFIGFAAALALLTFFIVAVLYRQTLARACVTAVAMAVGFYLVFAIALDVQLPRGVLGL